MPPPCSYSSTPTKRTTLGGDGAQVSPAKSNHNSPTGSSHPPRTPIRFGPRLSSDDARGIADRRRARQSVTPTKPLGRFESLCEDSKTILGDMAGMFSPGKVETKTPETSPFKAKTDMAVHPVKRRSGRDRRDVQGKQGQPPRKKVVGLNQIRRPAHRPANPTDPGEGSSKPLQ